MEKAIATVIITVASIAAIITVLNALMPAISRTNTSIVSAADSVDSRISTQLDIIEASGTDGSPDVEAWVKNDGGIEISPLDYVDVFFGTADSFEHIPYGTAGYSALLELHLRKRHGVEPHRHNPPRVKNRREPDHRHDLLRQSSGPQRRRRFALLHGVGNAPPQPT